MNIVRTLRELTDAHCSLSEMDADHLLGTLLDDGLPELEQGAALALLDASPITLPLLLGCNRALGRRCYRLAPPGGATHPVLLAAQCSPRRSQPSLLPLLALLLHRLGLTVLVHGALDGAGPEGCAHLFRSLDVMPCSSLVQAQRELDERRLAYVPTAVLAPGVARLKARWARLGGGRLVSVLHRLLDPYDGRALPVVATGTGPEARLLPSLFQLIGARALLLAGTDGEPFACPDRRPTLELVHAERRELLFAAEPGRFVPRPLREPGRAADWLRRALRGEVPLPLPLVNQIACCMYGAGYAADINQAKAIAALETGSLVPA
jgi:anthranilate phosphoribosyltransferase